MSISLTLDRVPELADLTRQQRRSILSYYQSRLPNVTSFRFLEVGFVGLFILAEIVGFIGGFVYWQTPFWGPLAGAVIGLVGALVAGYILNTIVIVPKIRRFLQSEEAQTLIRSFKKP